MADTPPVIKIRVEPFLCIPGVLDCYNYVYSNPSYPGALRLFVLATNGISARVVLDASESYDPDGNPVEVVWHEGRGEWESGFFARGAVVTNEFFIERDARRYGASITVSVNDAPMVNFGPPRYRLHLSILSPEEVLASIREVLHDEAPETRFNLSLQSILTVAISNMEQGETRRALRLLNIFKKRFDRRSIGLNQTQVDGIGTVTDIIVGLYQDLKTSSACTQLGR